MKGLLKKLVGKTLRIYTVSGVESYLGTLDSVEDEYIAIKGFFKEDRMYLAMQYIESFKVEEKA